MIHAVNADLEFIKLLLSTFSSVEAEPAYVKIKCTQWARVSRSCQRCVKPQPLWFFATNCKEIIRSWSCSNFP